MSSLQLVNLTALMERTSGSPDVGIGLIDGPVARGHPDLPVERLRVIPGFEGVTCAHTDTIACQHATFIAGVLFARRRSPAPAICPECTLLIRPVFVESTVGRERMPCSTTRELAKAVIDCIDAGARVINMSLATAQPSTRAEADLEEALDEAMRRGVIVVAAAGNQGTVGSSGITRHPWVIPVVACDRRGRPMNESNLAKSIGSRGLSAPGDAITSVSPDGQFRTLSGTSVAVPFVSGAVALLWSKFPDATAAEVKLAIRRSPVPGRVSVVPPLLDAAAAFRRLLDTNGDGARQ